MTTLPHVTFGYHETPTFVFLHGFMGRKENWMATFDALQFAGRFVALDLPGHGEAVGLPDEAYTFEGTVAAVRATLDALALDDAALVGYSMGGRMALATALEDDPPRRLALISASAGLRTEEERAARRRLDAQRADAIERDFKTFLDRWYASPLWASLQARPRLLDLIVRHRLRNDPVELAKALRGTGTGQMPALWEPLEQRRPSGVVMAGALDPKYVRLAEAVHAACPDLALELIPEAGHNVPAEHPTRLAKALRRHLSF